jgi:hypothetical protein
MADDEPQAGSYDWWYQCKRGEMLYGYSETLDAYYASQGIVIVHEKPTVNPEEGVQSVRHVDPNPT